MNSFFLRDARRQRLQDALTALGDQPSELREPLQTELAALQTDNWTVADRTYLAVGADWLWAARLTLKLQVDDDPVFLALGQPADLSAEMAAAIEDIPHGPGGPPHDYLDQVRGIVGNDETIFNELIHAGHRSWIVAPAATRSHPFDDVGVLLPVRLETLFDGPDTALNGDPTRWKLSLRVIPDEASICRDNRFVSADEQQVVAAFWNAIKQGGAPAASWLDGDQAGVAWAQLAAKVTAPRAAWLVANLPTNFDGETVTVQPPADMPDQPAPNRVGGFPPELTIFVNTTVDIAGAFEHTIGRLPMDPDQTINRDALTLPLPASFAEERERWWSHWTVAKAVGLGGEWLLPAGITPQTIEALYVVGIGEEAPETHFKSQIDAGELSLLRLGVPTNTVHGNAAADLGKSHDEWRKVAQVRLAQRANPNQQFLTGVGKSLQTYLVGSTTEVPYFPFADAYDDTQDSQRMAQALWFPLWGHWLLEWMGVGDDAFRVGDWMRRYFCPEGPLMPIRIDNQPYGLLPVTALSQWQTPPTFNQEGQAQAAIEFAMSRGVDALRTQWDLLVRNKRSVVGKTTEEFMQLLAQDALSGRYLHREFSPAWVHLAPYITAFGLDQQRQDEFLERAVRAYQPVNWITGRDPTAAWLTNGFWRRQELPLVQPTAMLYRLGPNGQKEPAELSQILVHLLEAIDLGILFSDEFRFRVLPNSLLIRLLVHAAQLALPWRRDPPISPQKNVVSAQEEALFVLAAELDQEGWREIVIDEVTGDIQRFTLNIPAARRKQLERALRATLDSAATRIDPWITGFAWQRLQQHSISPRRNQRLGVYGWVDGPFDGTPGPTDAGRLHTPSYNQTLAAIILRDKFLAADRVGLRNEAGRNPWEMNISSAKARLAEEIADEVRMGFHIYEIVGRHVETIIGEQVGGHEQVKRLRIHANYAMRPERQDPNEVCNGIAALLGLLQGDGDFPLTAAQRRALQQLHAALDTYSDLLVADGVMQLVNRQVERAAESMGAAAGFERPPTFEFTRTPPSGYQLESLVLSALPYRSVADLGDELSPIRLADPSVAAFLETQLGTDWLWHLQSNGDGQVVSTVSLTELGFAIHETLTLSADFLNELARRKLGMADAQVVSPRQHALAQQFVAALGGRPAAGRDFSNDPAIQQAADPAIYAELGERYGKLYAAASVLIAELQAAADDDRRALLLRRAVAWGVTPISEAADREAFYAALLGLPIPEAATPLATLVASVAAVLQKRLDDAPPPGALAADSAIAAPLADHEERKKRATPDGIPSLARAIANLAAPNGKLAILACWERELLVAESQLVLEQPEVGLDEEWLTVIAATRANLARLEALQLEMASPLTAWTNSSGDPWQQTLIAENLARRDQPHAKEPGESVLGVRSNRFVATYGTVDAWAGEKVAVGLIDTFSEAIPMPQRTSSAAFGFNAPSARAPQAILLAVAPHLRQPIDARLLHQILIETRQLAHGRTVRMEDLGEFNALAPTMWLQSSGPNRVHLEPYPIYA